VLAGNASPGAGEPHEFAAVVRMTDRLRFDPSRVTITAGATVKWENPSKLVHTVTADSGLAVSPQDVQLPPGARPFNSGKIAPGEGYSHTFTVPGLYRYFCIPHEIMGMVGEIVVEPDSAADPAGAAGWSWVESCHVLRRHQLTALSTAGSLLLTGELEGVLSHLPPATSRAGATYIATLSQPLWTGGELIIYADGASSRLLDGAAADLSGTDGLDQSSNFYISRLFVLQGLCWRNLQLAAGKMDLSDFFDTNAVANCEVNSFLAGNLVNDPVIPFPQAGLAAAARLSVARGAYLQGAIADASAVANRTDLGAVFRDGGRIYDILEVGLSTAWGSRGGNYRVTLWREPAPGNGAGDDGKAALGWGVSFDHAAGDDLTFFLRHGRTDRARGGPRSFWSWGASLAGPWPGRAGDTAQVGLALTEEALGDELMIEADYRLRLNDGLALTPLLQVLANAVGRSTGQTFVVAGLRAVHVF
jgi:plastocyanin